MKVIPLTLLTAAFLAMLLFYTPKETCTVTCAGQPLSGQYVQHWCGWCDVRGLR